jgi:cell division protein ZapA
VAEVDIAIAGRSYRIACRDGEEDNLRKAAALVDAKSREALAGLGTLSEARQMLFASLLLADQLIEGRDETAETRDPALAEHAERLANRLESLAGALEAEAARS